MNKKVVFFLIFISFVMGFLVHALFFPSFLTYNIALYTKRVVKNKQLPVVETKNKSLTYVYYEDGEFDPKVVTVPKSYYLGIINTSDTELMFLTSENQLLSTPRGYGRLEELRTILYEEGIYEVSSTLHPDRILKVIVK